LRPQLERDPLSHGQLMTGAQTVIDTAHLTLLPYSPDHLLALIEQPERFEELAGFPAADGLRRFLVSDEVSPRVSA